MGFCPCMCVVAHVHPSFLASHHPLIRNHFWACMFISCCLCSLPWNRGRRSNVECVIDGHAGEGTPQWRIRVKANKLALSTIKTGDPPGKKHHTIESEGFQQRKVDTAISPLKSSLVPHSGSLFAILETTFHQLGLLVSTFATQRVVLEAHSRPHWKAIF